MRSTQDVFNARYVVRSTNHGCDAIAARQKRCSLSVVGHIHAAQLLRVIVFSDRPARIRADLAVDLPYPRHRDHPELLSLRREALGLLGLAGDW